MGVTEISDELLDKVSTAANKSFQEYEEGFNQMKPEEVYKTAFINGYNCAYNIYDVAEEKLEAFRKDGEVPEKDIPDISVSGQSRAEAYLNQYADRVYSISSNEVYTMGYKQGFTGAWNEFINVPMNKELEEIVDYYLEGKE